MKLIVGLGNPETKYDGTRHNIGFWAIDSYLSTASDSEKNTISGSSKFKAEVVALNKFDQKVLFAKPNTYYNLIGESVRAIADFYKIDQSDILIIHDDLALNHGTVRTRIGGGDAGNNGLKSISTHVGRDTRRLRIGILNEKRTIMADADFVLAKLALDEVANLNKLSPTIHSLIEQFITEKFDTTTQRLQADS